MISDIKKRLKHKISVPAGLHYLVWSGKVLDDSHPLFWYGIKKGATLHLSTQLRGGGPKSHGETSASTADAAGAQIWTALVARRSACENVVCAGVPGCLSSKHTTHHAGPPLEDIFNACDADSSGQLDKDQVFFALK